MNVPTVFVLFGGTGDLARKKLIPSLFDLYQAGHLPQPFRAVGFSRKARSHEAYREFVKDSIGTRANTRNQADVRAFARLFSYQQGNLDDLESYATLKTYLERIDQEIGQCANKLLYVAVPPVLYEVIFDNLKRSGLSVSCGGGVGWTRVLVEKPFGRDLNTAQKLEEKLCATFTEPQIFRIDHYMAKDALQNILAFRFSNTLLEHAWNRTYIEHVHIKLLEDFGVEDRAAFYDGIGALRDMGQAHALGVLALVAMENPRELTPGRLRPERAKVLHALKAYAAHELPSVAVRAQHDDYHALEGVSKDSSTETYFLLKAFVDTKRWRGVPFYLESGKCLSETRTEIVVTFKPNVPHGRGHAEAGRCRNILTISIKPTQDIRLRLWVKKLGLTYELEPHDVTVMHAADEGGVTAYEKVLYDCIVGDQTLFPSGDEVRAAWAFVTPILKNWHALPLLTYEAGSRAPRSGIRDEIARIQQKHT